MSTVVLILVVVGVSVAVAMKLARSGAGKPATEPPAPHRAPDGHGRQHRRGRAGPSAPVALTSPHPGLFVRLRAGVGLLLIVALVGAGIAVGILAGAEVVSRALETAVE